MLTFETGLDKQCRLWSSLVRFYRNDPKFFDRYAWANSADPDQTADQGLHCLPFRLHRLDSLLYGRATSSNIRLITTNFLGVRIFRKFMVHCLLFDWTHNWMAKSHQSNFRIITATCEPPLVKTNNVVAFPAKTQISLGIRSVWSESSLCAQWVAKDPSFLHADSEDSDQTGRMPRLIRVFAGCTPHCWFCHEMAHVFSSGVRIFQIFYATF